MSIKQLGGVFGRNPTFNDVEINKLDVDNINIDGNTISVTNTNGDLTVEANGTGEVNIPSVVNILDGTNTKGILKLSGDSYKIEGGSNFGDIRITFPRLRFFEGANLVGQFDSDNLTVNRGNVVIGTSGKGIDFSATAGAGTSELFDDYEEGAWTPVVEGSTTAGTGTYANQIGLYTKVGRVVHFQCWLQVNSHTGTGVTLIKGLPFTSNSSNAKGTANLNYFANLTISASNTAGLQVANGQTYLVLKEFPVGGGLAGSVAIDPNMQINFSGSYTV